MSSLRVLVVDDHRLFRQGLVGLLRSEPGFEVVGEASSMQEALRVLRETQPNVAILDLGMPDVSGSELIKAVMDLTPPPAVVVLTASEDSADLLQAIQAGATGYVTKNADVDTLLSVIRKVHAGGSAVCDAAMLNVLDLLRGLPVPSPTLDSALTAREQEVAALIIDGWDNREIATRLSISENTVRTHAAHILEKLGMRKRAELIAAGRRRIGRS